MSPAAQLSKNSSNLMQVFASLSRLSLYRQIDQHSTVFNGSRLVN
jgi:hypothetical protein